MSDQVVEIVTGEYFPHRALWVDALNLFDLSEELNRGAAYSSALGSMVLMSFVLEGFVNFLVEKVRPETWKKRRTFFSRDPYQGTLGKLRYIAAEVAFAFDQGARPYETIQELQRRRNLLAHNHLDSYSLEVPLSETSIFRYESEYSGIADQQFLSMARADLESFCNALQERAYASSGVLELKGPALRSYVSHGSGTIKRS
jgi:hypothetical protein